MRVQGITQRPDIVAIADAADHINDIKAHRRRADIPAPGLILPADRHARARIGGYDVRCISPAYRYPSYYRIFHPHP